MGVKILLIGFTILNYILTLNKIGKHSSFTRIYNKAYELRSDTYVSLIVEATVFFWGGALFHYTGVQNQRAYFIKGQI